MIFVISGAVMLVIGILQVAAPAFTEALAERWGDQLAAVLLFTPQKPLSVLLPFRLSSTLYSPTRN